MQRRGPPSSERFLGISGNMLAYFRLYIGMKLTNRSLRTSNKELNNTDHFGSVKKSAILAQAMLVRFKFLPPHPQPNMTLLLRTTGR